MRHEFDVIVVGAGPSGSACALQLAREGVNTLLIEKRRFPGEKNTSGGIVYGGEIGGFGLKSLVPNFETTAPLERKIRSHEVIALSNPDEKKQSYRSFTLTRESLTSRFGIFSVEFETGHDYTVLRSRFDRWLANAWQPPPLPKPSQLPQRKDARLGDVRRAVAEYVAMEHNAGNATCQKRAWPYAKAKLPNATRDRVFAALREIDPPKGRGKPRKAQ